MPVDVTETKSPGELTAEFKQRYSDLINENQSLAKKIKAILEPETSKNIVLLDGDNIRSILPYQIAYSNEDRLKLAFFYSKLALLIEKSNCIVICSFLALFHSVQEHTRLNANDLFEIFLDPPFDELAKKNKKDLYIGSTEKSNIMGENVDEIFDSFELLEKRDRWSMDNRKVDKLDGIISKEQGIIFHIGGNVNNLLAI